MKKFIFVILAFVCSFSFAQDTKMFFEGETGKFYIKEDSFVRESPRH